MKSNLVNEKFGKLKVLKLSDRKRNRSFLWECRCKCGNITYSNTQNLLTGHKKSCGICTKANLVGLKVNKLEVIEYAGVDNRYEKHSQHMWLCRCECGKEVLKPTALLTKKKVKSCGCYLSAQGNENHNWKGYGEISGSMWKQIKSCGKLRGLTFKVSLEYLWELYLKQNRRCALSGLEIGFALPKEKGKTTASLDRIDSTKGYEEDNIQWLHKDVNKMKTDFKQEYFIELCKLTAKGYNENQ